MAGKAPTAAELSALLGRAVRLLSDPELATDAGKRDELAQLVDTIDPDAATVAASEEN